MTFRIECYNDGQTPVPFSTAMNLPLAKAAAYMAFTVYCKRDYVGVRVIDPGGVCVFHLNRGWQWMSSGNPEVDPP